MSPAPVRANAASGSKFPHSWGYVLGVLLMLIGIAVGAVLVISAIQGFSDDVRSLRRAANVDDLELSLDRGEYFVFDEDGLGVGPFDVRVIRRSDGRQLPTSEISDGTTYDVDGRQGRARVAFDVPALDIYRVEVNASLESAARFAVGGDVGNDRANRIVQGIVLGAVGLILGFIVIVGTLFLHARWKVRSELAERVTRARDVVGQATGNDDPAAALGPDGASGLADRARERLEAVRESVNTQSGEGRPPPWRTRTSQQANQVLDSIEKRLDQVEPVVSDAATDARLADRIDEALGRVQDRVASGDSLRSIAKDERVLAEQSSAELEAQAREFRQRVTDEVDPFEPATITESWDEVADQAREGFQAIQAEGAAIGTDFVETVRSDALDSGDALIAGTTAAAAAAVASTAELARTSTADLADSTLPTPPVLAEPPAPPESELRPPVEPAGTLEPEPEPVLVEEATAEMAPPFIAPPPAMLGLRERRSVAASSTEVDVEEVEQGSEPFTLAPPPSLRPLAAPAIRHNAEEVAGSAEGRDEEPTSADDDQEGATEAALAGTGRGSAGFTLAPPPPVRPLGRPAKEQDA